jgi:succinate dehydrogenase / fumarate reductase flavoprotein subunit
VPFAREYGGLLDNRSFGGVQVSRTFYARGQTGQQLLIGAYQALERQVAPGTVRCSPARDARLVVVDGRARGIIARDLVTGEIETPLGRRGRARHRRLRQRLLPVDQRHGLQRHGHVARAPQGRLLRQPLLHADPPDLHPAVRRPPVEADADVGVAAQRRPHLGAQEGRGLREGPAQIPEEDRDYYLERIYPSVRQPGAARHRLAARPRTCATRAAASARSGLPAVYLDFADAIKRIGRGRVEEKYGNLFDMYARITGENPYETPMRIYPAVHYTMGGLWVDYDLQSTIPGLFVAGEANFSDHGANRLGASALMQGLADGYFVLPNTIRDYLAKGAVTRRCRPTTRPSPRPRRPRRGARRRAARDQGTAPSTPSTRSSAHHVGVLRHGAHARRACAQGHRAHPRAARGVLAQRQASSARRHPQPEPREGRPGRRLPRVRRAHVHRRAAPRESCGGHFRAETRPRTARPSATTTSSSTSRPGSSAARPAATGPHTGAARVRERPARLRSYK